MQKISTERIRSLDIVRGVAVLGILLINFPDMAFPEDLVMAFHVTDPDKGLNYWSGIISEILISGKFRGIFTLLFGVSSVLIFENLAGKLDKAEFLKIYFGRLFWLLLFGLVNAYLFLWWGDVLFKYAVLGMLLIAFWRAPYWVLTAATLFCLMILTVHPALEYRELVNLQQKNIQVELKRQSGQTPTPDDLDTLTHWQEALQDIQPQKEAIEREIKAKAGNFIGVFSYISRVSLEEQTYIFFTEDIWDMLIFMILGILLFRVGYFDESRRQAQHMVAAFFGVGIGVIIHSWIVLGIYQDPFDPVRPQFYLIFENLGRLPFVVGYVSLIILAFRAGFLQRVGDWMTAVGRMALSNYLISSVAGAFIFYEFGLALFNQLSRIQVLFLVLIVWTAQVVFSVIWMNRFHYGPFEWIWRSLTYFKAQPLDGSVRK